mmetsp:Transcript_23068/g.64001  ORF Transcript_23068/g.64001 Transcript_23068/m.64001 type:complete len:214 (-) Transcript_23068:1601-2242(-)
MAVRPPRQRLCWRHGNSAGKKATVMMQHGLQSHVAPKIVAHDCHRRGLPLLQVLLCWVGPGENAAFMQRPTHSCRNILQETAASVLVMDCGAPAPSEAGRATVIHLQHAIPSAKQPCVQAVGAPAVTLLWALVNADYEGDRIPLRRQHQVHRNIVRAHAEPVALHPRPQGHGCSVQGAPPGGKCPVADPFDTASLHKRRQHQGLSQCGVPIGH